MFDRIFQTGLTRKYDANNSQDYFVNQMIGTNRFLNCLETGSGKTKIVIEGIEELMNAGFVTGGVILCPSTGVWIRNFNEWASPEFMRAVNIREITSNRKEDFCDLSTHIFVMTYHTFSAMYNQYRNNFSRWGQKGILVMDEAHAIKNYTSKRTKHCVDVSRFFTFRTCMTATPTDKGFENLWGIMRVLLPSQVPERYNSFLQEIAVVVRLTTPYQIDKDTGSDDGEEKATRQNFYYKIERYKHAEIQRYKDMLEPYICKGTTNVIKKQEIDIRFLMVDPDIQFSRIYKMFCVLLTSRGSIGKRNIFNLTRLFLGNPLLFKGDGWVKIEKHISGITKRSWLAIKEYVDMFTVDHHTKVKWLLEFVKDYFTRDDADRLVLWFYHPEIAELVSNELRKRDISTKLLISRTKNAKDYVFDAVEDFNKNESLQVLVTTVGVIHFY